MAVTPPPLHHRLLLLLFLNRELNQYQQGMEADRRSLERDKAALLEQQSDLESREADLDDSTARLSTDRIHVEAMRLSNQQAAEELDEQRMEIRAVQDTLLATQSAQDSRDATLVDKQRELEDSDSALLR
mmetsp:Transcript_755/g.1748  ORF Transcript_755/g.1748 Transcript_755/m.1748 type:complete len:130 (+) Transcript_755:197-586(+)